MTAKQELGAERELAERSATYYVHPEYKVPSDKTPDSAVAEGLKPGVRVWQWSGDESLHPFWAIQRLSADELEKKNGTDIIRGRFNVTLTESSTTWSLLEAREARACL